MEELATIVLEYHINHIEDDEGDYFEYDILMYPEGFRDKHLTKIKTVAGFDTFEEADAKAYSDILRTRNTIRLQMKTHLIRLQMINDKPSE